MSRGAAGLALILAIAAATGPPEGLGAGPTVPPCRCAQQTLADYFSAADEVVLARLVDWEEGEMVAERPWKVAPARSESVEVGDTVRYLTARSTAGCGIQPVRGAVYAIFAAGDPTTGESRVDTCSGTRVFVESEGAPPRGFTDVPGPFVSRQLDALSGLAFLRAAAAAAPDVGDRDNETLVGLLDLKALAHGGSVPVRASPDSAAPIVTTVRSYDEVASREVSYEVPGAVVVARAGRWSRIRLGDGFGWVAPEDAGTWFPYPELPVRRLNYLTGAWSGHIWPDPGAGLPHRSSRVPAGMPDRDMETPVEVHESTMVGGMPWFRVAILSASPCDGGEVRVERSGWVPGYGAGGEPLVWYYSRGC